MDLFYIMWKVHAYRFVYIFLVFALLFAFDSIAKTNWFANIPVVMGMASVLLGVGLARRMEKAKSKKNDIQI